MYLHNVSSTSVSYPDVFTEKKKKEKKPALALPKEDPLKEQLVFSMLTNSVTF